jgi:ATP-dependent RNA helicase DDX24/MAK5
MSNKRRREHARTQEEDLPWNEVEEGAGYGFEMEEAGFFGLEEIDGDDVNVFKDANGMWQIVPKKKQQQQQSSEEVSSNGSAGKNTSAVTDSSNKKKKSKDNSIGEKKKIVATEEERAEQARKKSEAKKRKKLLKKEQQKIKKKRKTGQGGGAVSSGKAVDTKKFERAIRKKLKAIDLLKNKRKDGQELTIDQKTKLERENDLLEQLEKCVNGTLEAPTSSSVSSSSSAARLPSVNTMDEWRLMGLDNNILSNLKANEFYKPTNVQSKCIPLLLHKRKDIIAAAETGSGKTLSFGLPLVQMISWRSIEKRKKEPLSALILCPTRELALQVQRHINVICMNTTVTICCIVGGISEDKQVRLLNKRPDIVVGTPGRLWIHISQGHPHLAYLNQLKYLVLDEADRMLDRGHYAELNQIVLQITRSRVEEQVSDDDIDDDIDDGTSRVNKKSQKSKRQTMLFSATMMLDGDGRLNAKLQKGKSRKKRKKKTTTSKILEDLMARVGCNGNPVIVDMNKMKQHERAEQAERDRLANIAEAGEANDNNESNNSSSSSSSSSSTIEVAAPRALSSSSSLSVNQALPDNLELARIECTQDDKELYVYYFCMKHPGRTIIFANSIAVVRKLSMLLKLMQINVFPLHAQMQQSQRLKNMDRFKSQKNIVLVASDVAARGLDVPNVDYVLHFNVPRTPEIFIHRSGRTARASRSGLALTFLSPKEDERRGFNNICKTLNMTREDMTRFDINMAYMPHVRTRVKLGKRLRTVVTKNSRAKADQEWFKQHAEATEIMLDSEEEEVDGVFRRKECTLEERLRNQLREMLSTPLLGRGGVSGSRKYQHGR